MSSCWVFTNEKLLYSLRFSALRIAAFKDV
jgi:hypothetical protein